jgi:hypothetical protein
MAVRPMGIAAGGVEVWHDEFQHGGTVAWADVDFGKRGDGVADQRAIYLPCPVPGCDSASWHPVTGGVDRPAVRELFARYFLRRAQALGLNITTIAEARDYVRARSQEIDGRDD